MDKMIEAFERDHGPLCADKDMQKYFARHEGAMKWAWQAARTVPEASSSIFASRCPMCSYQHGHQIGCENNPIDIALRAATPEPKK